MKKIAVLLNGCGHRDGSEIHEATLTLLAIEEAGAAWECLAPNRNQATVLDHITGLEPTPGSNAAAPRNMLSESARIARGRIKDLALAQSRDYAALIIPGGSGTAKNLCNFATAGTNMTVDPMVAEFMLAFQQAGKPIGAICIAPILLAKVFGRNGAKLTLGEAQGGAADAARAMGCQYVACAARDCVVDEKLRLVTTPAYMLDTSIGEIAQGIRKLVKQVLDFT